MQYNFYKGCFLFEISPCINILQAGNIEENKQDCYDWLNFGKFKQEISVDK